MRRVDGHDGLWFELLDNGAVRRIGRGDAILTLWVGSEAEGHVGNLWLRVHGDAGAVALHPLLGPASGARLAADGLAASGSAGALRWRLALRLAADAPAWFWHVAVDNAGDLPARVDVVHVQDLALASYGAVRLNEYYVSQYVDLQPLDHPRLGTVVAARQNVAVGDRHPWALVGAIDRAVGWATDALQLQGLGVREGARPEGLVRGLPNARLQHEHALAALQSDAKTVAPGASAAFGFWGRFERDHPGASGAPALALADATLALPEAAPPADRPPTPRAAAASLFATAPWLATLDLDAAELDRLVPGERRHAERDDAGAPLSFFDDAGRHAVLRAKELAVMRPHGHVLRGGAHLVPDETALVSTAWMNGVFHSMVCQGHVSINRFLSTVHGQHGLFRSHGQRVFVRADGGDWQQLGLPSAWVVDDHGCRWLYRHAGGTVAVESRVHDDRLTLDVSVLYGGPLGLLVTHHVALGGDDGSGGPLPSWRRDGDAVVVTAPPDSDVGRRFPAGTFTIAPTTGRFASVRGDAALYADGQQRGEPYLCIEAEAAPRVGLAITAQLIEQDPVPAAPPLPLPRLHADGVAAAALDRLQTALPWFAHDALVHYLAPRGLEQYSGGGWGTRDVCQGPLEMLLGFDRTAPVRTILEKVFAEQNADGDWPQWFSVFARERDIRAGDSHGDIVFWPLLGLARYLAASGDHAFLDAPLPFFDGTQASVWQHVQRALGLIAQRRIGTTRLAAYGHGDWNDSLQPADPALRDELCSAWTVTLHHQTLAALVKALHAAGRAADAAPLQADADAIGDDFRRLLVQDGVVAGYARFDHGADAPAELLLHPADTRTGLRYSLLPMMHAVLADLLPKDLALAQLALVKRHLLGVDGARLFDRPMPYHGGPETTFQRAESSAHFGREIGLMYMHAQIRWAEALAHAGDAAGFLAALERIHPVGVQAAVPAAARRQANCYFSSSDAAFADRYAAQRDYAEAVAGRVRLEGGWRVYSSGPGIALALVMKHLVGVAVEHDAVVFDPVLPPAADGLRVEAEFVGHRFEIVHRVGGDGCGPREVVLNGQPLAFTERPNPLRRGAAAVQRGAFDAACRSAGNHLIITLG